MTRFTLSWPDAVHHYFEVEMTLTPTPGPYTDLKLPNWRPGRYILQHYAAGVSHLTVQDDAGRPSFARKVAKATWRVDNPAEGALTVRYRYLAKVFDAGSSYVD